MVDSVLYCDEPAVSNDKRVTLGRRATIHDPRAMLQQMQREPDEEQKQMEELASLASKVAALEKLIGVQPPSHQPPVSPPKAPAPIMPVESNKTDLVSTDLDSPAWGDAPTTPGGVITAALGQFEPVVAVIPGQVSEARLESVSCRGTCGACGKDVLTSQERYVENGKYFHQVFLHASFDTIV